MIAPDMAQYLGVFLDEAAEQLAVLEKSLLELEHGASADLLQEIFRAAHTLKGSSRAMGFRGMADLTHAMEDVFDRLRQGTAQVTRPMIDILLEAVDRLAAMKEEVTSSGANATQAPDLTARLHATMGEGIPAADGTVGVDRVEPAAAEPAAAGSGATRVVVEFAADCVMKSLRALMVIQSLQSAGTVLATVPAEADIENDQVGSTLEVLLQTDRPAEEVREDLLRISEVVSVHVAETQPGAEPAAGEDELPDERVWGDLSRRTRGKSPEELAVASQAALAHAQPAQTIRVDVSRLDTLLNLVGELVIDQTRISQLAAQFDASYQNEPLVESLSAAAAHVSRITGEMQEQVMKARMLPIDSVFSRFPRMVRDLSTKLGKEVEFVVGGGDTELDRSVIEIIGDPLIHLLRNSLDHGIERPDDREAAGKPRAGTVSLCARHEENHIVIEIVDDGKGIDPAKVRESAVERGLVSAENAQRMTDREAIGLIFSSGLSTASSVSDVSGRGVGMDIVRSNLTRIGATVDVESELGRGSRFTIRLPLTLAIIRGLLIGLNNGVYAVPLTSVIESLRLADLQIHVVNHVEMTVQRGRTLPLIRLDRFYRGHGARLANARGDGYVVVVGIADRRVGLVVDELLGEQEIVIKTLGAYVGDVHGISGATILGDGKIALIVDVERLATTVHEDVSPPKAA